MGHQSDGSTGLLLIPLYDIYFLGDIEIFCFSIIVLCFHFFALKLQKSMARAHFQLFVMNTSIFLQHLTSISSTMSQ